jgi:endonuclease/exonuclease/phosphatase family metal-dependent hydrolase
MSADYTIPTPPKKSLIVMEYNLNKNGRGHDSPYETGMPGIISLLNGTHPTIPIPDILLLSEVAYNCKPDHYINGADEIARNLNMSFAFVVEYIDIDPNDTTHKSQCTVGNALLSRYPMRDIIQKRFSTQCCSNPPKRGGCIEVMAEVNVGIGIPPLLVHATHLETGNGVYDFVQAWITRVGQAREMATSSDNENYEHIIMGGDLNSPLQGVDPVIETIKENGFHDAFDTLSFIERESVPFDPLSKLLLGDDDYIFFRGGKGSNPVVCHKEYEPACYGPSDHVPIWFTYSF